MKNELKINSANNGGIRNHLARIVILICLSIIVILSAIALILGQLIVIRSYIVPSHASGKIRIVGIADLHGHCLGKNQNRIVRKVENADPDIIVYLGDMIDRESAKESAHSLITLTEHLIKIAPVYYVDGNHEQDIRDNQPETYTEINNTLSKLGAVQLNNQIIQLTIDSSTGTLLGQEFIESVDPDSESDQKNEPALSEPKNMIINLCGISTHYYWDSNEAEVAAVLRKLAGINVMICHYPETVIWRGAFEGGGLDLALCGHTHGGLVRVPFRGGMYAPEWGWWPMYDLGEYSIYSDTRWNQYGGGTGAQYWGTLIISGGLAGEHGIPRINNPMEISIVEVGESDDKS